MSGAVYIMPALAGGILSIQGVYNYTPDDLQAGLEFLDRNHQHYPFSGLVSETLGLEDTDAIFHHATKTGALRPAVKPRR